MVQLRLSSMIVTIPKDKSSSTPRSKSKHKGSTCKKRKAYAVVGTTQKKRTYRKQFRSNLTKLTSLFAKITLQPAHLQLLQTTPFFDFVQPFINHEVTPKFIKGTKSGVEKIIATYCKQQKHFIIGGKQLMITPSEFDVILGIPSGTKELNTKDSRLEATSIKHRRFSSIKEAKPKHLREELEKIINGKSSKDVEDSVKIIALYVISNILFVSSSEAARLWMYRICDNLSNLGQYNWGKEVIEYLIDQITTKDQQDVSGCTTLLQYWICERTNLIAPSQPNSYPRYMKWDLSKLKKALKQGISCIQPRQVLDNPLPMRTLELKALKGKKYTFEVGSTSHSPAVPFKLNPDSNTTSSSRRVTFKGINFAPDDNNTEDEDNIPIAKLKFSPTPHITSINTNTSANKPLTPIANFAPPKTSTNLSNNQDEAVDRLQNELITVRTKLTATIQAGRHWKQMYLEEVSKTELLAAQLKSQQAEYSSLEEKLLELSLENTELLCGISPLPIPPKNIVIYPQSQNTTANQQFKAKAPSTSLQDPSFAQSLKDPIHQQTPTITPTQTPTIANTLSSQNMTPPATCRTKGKAPMTEMQDPGFTLAIIEPTKTPVAVNQISSAMVPIYLQTQAFTPPIAKRTRSHTGILSPFPTSSESKLVKNYRMCAAFRSLSPGHKFMIDDLSAQTDNEGGIAWASPDRAIEIRFDDVFNCLHRRCVSETLINTYSQIRANQQENNITSTILVHPLQGTTYVFDSLIIEKVRRCSTQTFRPAKCITQHRYLLLPIIHYPPPTRKGRNHWTLLALDTKEGTWRYYNSSLPQPGNPDPYLEDAKYMQDAFTRTMRSYGISFPLTTSIISVKDTPQQKTTADCGVAVIYIIRQYYNQELITKSRGEAELPEMRTEIIKTLLDWAKDRDYYEDRFMKRPRIA